MPNDDRYTDPMRELDKLQQERRTAELDEQNKEFRRKKAAKYLTDVSDDDLRAEFTRRGF